MTDELANWVDEQISRRGFLSKAGAACAAIGLGTLGGAFRPGAARASILTPLCCDGVQCTGCPTTIGKCPTNYDYTGYTWTCCYGPRLAYCWDCVDHFHPETNGCYCNLLTGNLC